MEKNNICTPDSDFISSFGVALNSALKDKFTNFVAIGLVLTDNVDDMELVVEFVFDPIEIGDERISIKLAKPNNIIDFFHVINSTIKESIIGKPIIYDGFKIDHLDTDKNIRVKIQFEHTHVKE